MIPQDLMEYEMVEHFGGLTEYLEAESWRVYRHECVWIGKNRATAIKEQRQQESYAQAYGAGGM